jgi:tellurite resistance protein TerC
MPWWIYALFLVFVTALILLDLLVLHRKDEKVSIRQAFFWTGFWILLALLFNVFVYLLYNRVIFAEWITESHALGPEAALDFFTGYVIEKSLSLDNIFVIAMIIGAFRVPAQYQHRLLFFGILGAVVLRALMIFAGARLISQFDWMMYVFGAVLVISAVRMSFGNEEDYDPESSLLVRMTRMVFPVTTKFDGHNFFTVEEGTRKATPMLLALILIEGSDVMFAVDSIPAVLAITRDPFLVLTSNVFAILGLRSLYFALAGMMDQFRYLRPALVMLLLFVGMKMLLEDVIHINNLVSLGIICAIVTIGILASLWSRPAK